MPNIKKQVYESCFIVGIQTNKITNEQTDEYLDELEFLAQTAGGKVFKRFIQKVEKPNFKTFIGSGKLEEILKYKKKLDVSTVIFDDELTPTQQRNIESFLKCKVVDRSSLILDIFAQRARTSYATTQVELAQYNYLLPRLAGLWTHLERQRGGIGMRGPGEREIETDRRIIRNKISLLKKKLEGIDKQMATQRKGRGNMIKVSLVGYTNAGKSTLMNILSKSDILAEDKLFATLDTTVRKVVINNIPFLLSDTVGFIRKLPTQLIEAFKSTLDEVRQSDIVLHVSDISNSTFLDKIEVVNKTLKDIDALGKPVISIFNKIDCYQSEDDQPFENEKDKVQFLKNSWYSKNFQNPVFISAVDKTNIEELKKIVFKEVSKIYFERYPNNKPNNNFNDSNHFLNLS